MSRKNLTRYYQAWELRQQGKKLREIGEIMGFGAERARTLISYIDIKIKYNKPISKELKKLIKKYATKTSFKFKNINIESDELENIRVKYQASLDLFKSEGQIQWSRYSTMLIVNTIFVGLISTTYNNSIFFKQNLLFMPLAGILLCVLWFLMTKKGFVWINFWIVKARKLEKYINDKNNINSINQGNEFREQKHDLINTEVASYVVIAIIGFIYLLFFINKKMTANSFLKTKNSQINIKKLEYRVR